MKFKRVPFVNYPADRGLLRRGYQFTGAPVQCDAEVLADIRRTRGKNYADGLLDQLADGFEPICTGEDGKLYSVLFDSKEEPRAVYWQEIDSCPIPYSEVLAMLECDATHYAADQLDDFISDAGWQPEWMRDFMDDPDAEEISDEDERRINDVLRTAWKHAHKGAEDI